MELAELVELLTAPECRMVTLIGPGGIGKTRLALEVAEVTRERFADGVAYVPLQLVSASDSIAPAIATAVGLPLAGREDEREQVARFLRPLQILLVLDNFEHIIGEAPWLGELLATAPGLRALVTSREALNVREEWRYPLAGLAMSHEKTDDPSQSEAVRLFVERARQVRRDFSFESERDGVVQLCQITEGMPLALELAAVWIKMLSPSAIATEIERNIAFLATNLNNVPARHRSMHAAFDYSWALLSDEERAVFRRLAVFRGGFERDAAERVAGATLQHLSSLVDKSLLRAATDGRFFLHELLRQYAEERLRAEPEAAEQTYGAHRNFYLGFLAAQHEPITGGNQRKALTVIGRELDNIRAAWRSAVAAGDIEALSRGAHTLSVFYDFRARYREALGMLEDGLRAMRAAAPSLVADRGIAAILVEVARFQHHLGQLSAMRVAIEESEERYARLGEPPPPGQMTDPHVLRSLLALIDGDYAEAARLGAESVQRSEANDRPGNLPLAWWVQAAAALWQEDIVAAVENSRRCTEAALAIGDRWYLTYAHNMQGHVATACGDYVDARQHYETGYTIREEFNDPEGMGTALAHLGKVTSLQGDWAAAEKFFRRSLVIARDIGDQVTMAHALNGLGVVYCATGDYTTAGVQLAEGLRLMAGSGFMRLFLTLMASAGDLLLQTQRPADAVRALALVHAHPSADHETRARAERLLTASSMKIPRDAYDEAYERGRDADPVAFATLLIPILTEPPLIVVAPPTGSTGPNASPLVPPDQSAATGLSPRQIEVLRLVARGMTDAEIANALFISPRTVSGHLQSIYNKLGISSRAAATAFAYEQGLV